MIGVKYLSLLCHFNCNHLYVYNIADIQSNAYSKHLSKNCYGETINVYLSESYHK